MNFYAPDDLVRLIDQAITDLDLDRAKFIRAAIREKAERHGVVIKEAA